MSTRVGSGMPKTFFLDSETFFEGMSLALLTLLFVKVLKTYIDGSLLSESCQIYRFFSYLNVRHFFVLF